MSTFNEFVDGRQRRAKKQLKILGEVLKKQGMTVREFLDGDDPHIFLKSNQNGLSFDGIRIYKIGGDITYRIQKEEKTHPYGKAYILDVEGMWDDLIGDNVSEEKAGKKILEAVKEEFDSFFANSLIAEKKIRAGDFDKKGNPLGNVMLKSSGGTDYSNLVQSKSPH